MADANDSPTPPPAPAPGGSKLVPALLALNLLAVAALLAVFLLRGGAASAPAAPAAGPAHARESAAAPPGPTIKLADFIVHLRDTDADRYARVTFDVEVATEEDRTRLTPLVPRVRDAFIAYLSDRTVEELRGSDAIARTKAALSERLGALAAGVDVRALYVTDLVIQ